MAQTSLVTLSRRDVEILSVLSLRVRGLSLRQIHRCWWESSKTASDVCRRRLQRLEEADLLLGRHVTAIDLAELPGPLVSWAPGRYVPDLGALAWTLKRRWQAPPRGTTVFMATARCARYFGGRRHGRISRAFQVSHDLGVAEMFLSVRRTHPEWVEHWIDEDRFAATRRGQKLPDAVIASDLAALPALVLEFGGDYSKSRLQAFHDDNESRGLAYQIW